MEVPLAHPSQFLERCRAAWLCPAIGLALAALCGLAGCAGEKTTHQRAQPLIAPAKQVTLVWAWDDCLKNVEGLRAIARVQEHFASDDRVEVTTVYAGEARPGRIASIMAKHGVDLPWRADPGCGLCSQMPASFWDRWRSELEKAGAPPEVLEAIGSELPLPTLLIMDAGGQSIAFSGWPLGMDQAQYAASLSESIEGALAGEFSELTAPHIPWEVLSPTELERALSQARSQLNRWQMMEAAEVEAAIGALRARAKR